MTAKTKPAFEPETTYRVDLSKPVRLEMNGRMRVLRPSDDVVVKGKVANTIAHSIAKATKV